MKHGNLLLFITMLWLGTSQAFAFNYTWNGSSSMLWTDPLNWTPNGVPGAADNVSISGGMPNNPVLWGNATFTNLTMSAGATLNVVDYTMVTTGNVNVSNSTITSLGGIYNCNGSSNIFTNSIITVFLNVNGGTWSINSCTFNYPVALTKTGGAGIISTGGNVYNDVLSIVNNSTYSIRLGVTNPDIFNASSSFENQSTGTISLAYNSANTIFNGNVTISSAVSLGFMNFGIAGGTSTLNNGFTIVEGATGFLGGTLEIRNLTQLGTSITHTLDLTLPVCCSSSALILKLGPGVTFNGDVNFIASNILLNGGVYNSPTHSNFTKAFNGSAASNISDGGNVFNSPDTYITNATSSTLTLSNLYPDDYNGNAHFIKGISSSNIHVAYNAVSTFAGNIEVAGSTFAAPPIQFGFGTGGALLDGTGNQIISRLNPLTIGPPSITRLTTNKPSGSTLLSNTSVNVLNSLTLTNGLFNTSTGNYMILNNGATTSIGSPISFINGPMIYMSGTTAAATLNLPIGKGGIHRPAILNVLHSDATVVSYTAEVMNTSAMALGYSMPPTINHVSYVRYWQIDRQAIANLVNANVTLYYGPDDVVTDPNNLSIAKTIGAGTAWFDMGGTGTAPVSGSITSIPFNTFSKFTLANRVGGTNPLPLELVEFDAQPKSDRVNITWTTASEINNDYFTVERSKDGINYESIEIVDGAGNNNTTLHYSCWDNDPYQGTSYYRLKHSDYDLTEKYSDPVSVSFGIPGEVVIEAYPNPFSDDLNISIRGMKGKIFVIISDMAGNVFYQTNILTHEDSYATKLKSELLPSSGIYLLQVKCNDQFYTKKLVFNGK